MLAADPELMALKFFDDITTHGNSWEYVWDQTLRALRLLAAAGFMVNLRKCASCVARAVVLGLEISYATCALGEKYLRKWLLQRLPCNLDEL